MSSRWTVLLPRPSVWLSSVTPISGRSTSSTSPLFRGAERLSNRNGESYSSSRCPSRTSATVQSAVHLLHVRSLAEDQDDDPHDVSRLAADRPRGRERSRRARRRLIHRR